MKKFKFEKVSNMIMLVDENNQVWRAWEITEFTDRKMKNAIKKNSKKLSNIS